MIAADDLREAYPGRKIFVVDTLSASLGQGLLVYLCVQESGREDHRPGPRLCGGDQGEGVPLVHRGRPEPSEAWRPGQLRRPLFGTMLSIKPVLHVDDTGHLVPVSKTQGRKASLLALVDRMAESAVDPAGQTIFISHGDCEADAEFVADEVRRRFGVQDIYINYVGPVIGNHSGPGTLALFFLGAAGEAGRKSVPSEGRFSLRSNIIPLRRRDEVTAVKWLEVHIDTNHTGLEPVETMLSALGIDGVVTMTRRSSRTSWRTTGSTGTSGRGFAAGDAGPVPDHLLSGAGGRGLCQAGGGPHRPGGAEKDPGRLRHPADDPG